MTLEERLRLKDEILKILKSTYKEDLKPSEVAQRLADHIEEQWLTPQD